MKTAKVNSLVLDYDIYPRTSTNSTNVHQIAEAMSCGVEMPPVLVDKKSRRVVDGFHRCKAALRVHGQDATISVIERDFKNDAELFLEAIRLNSSHGYKLDTSDRARCIIFAEKLKIKDVDLCRVMNVSVDKVSSLRNTRISRYGTLTNPKGGASVDGPKVPIKTTIKHMAGLELNERQVAANDKLSGMNQVFYVNQLIELFESDLVDWTNENFTSRLRHLSELIDTALAVK